MVLYTSDATESGRHSNHQREALIAEEPDIWEGRYEPVIPLRDAIANRRQFHAMTEFRQHDPRWEWNHADPPSDPWNYRDHEGALLTYSFNRRYTVADAAALAAFRTPDGLAMIRHYCLNEDAMSDADGRVLGYFVSDVEPAGPYCMLTEVTAMANGDPRFLGYLSAHNFNRGFPAYVRAFNQAFLALPAIESEVVDLGQDPTVTVRAYPTQQHGTWYAVINPGYHSVTTKLQLPASATVFDATTGAQLATDTDTVELELRPCELRSLRVNFQPSKAQETAP
ncbi:MAG: hypothetical protein E1N59_1904 [Puniceicoccaceae bacterium 5H]|nr:MAG: hypothetical protein E1N59_1904 [Puniceicoccaceae bacterium 5H]